MALVESEFHTSSTSRRAVRIGFSWVVVQAAAWLWNKSAENVKWLGGTASFPVFTGARFDFVDIFCLLSELGYAAGGSPGGTQMPQSRLQHFRCVSCVRRPPLLLEDSLLTMCLVSSALYCLLCKLGDTTYWSAGFTTKRP